MIVLALRLSLLFLLLLPRHSQVYHHLVVGGRFSCGSCSLSLKCVGKVTDGLPEPAILTCQALTGSRTLVATGTYVVVASHLEGNDASRDGGCPSWAAKERASILGRCILRIQRWQPGRLVLALTRGWHTAIPVERL